MIRELVEDSYDEDATRGIVTLCEGYAVIEDDVDMNEEVCPNVAEVWEGQNRRVWHREAQLPRLLQGHEAEDEECVTSLASGQASVKVLDESPLERDGSEIWLLGARSKLDAKHIVKELSQEKTS